MPRYSEKSQYTKIKERLIYLMRSPLTKEFFISHCEPDSLLPIYRQHCAGKRYYTNVCISELEQQGLRPCLTILGKVKCTQVEAYRHVVAWTKLFVDAGFVPLNTGNILDYIEDLLDSTKVIYEKIKDVNFNEICDCKACEVSNYGRKRCALFEAKEHERS